MKQSTQKPTYLQKILVTTVVIPILIGAIIGLLLCVAFLLRPTTPSTIGSSITQPTSTTTIVSVAKVPAIEAGSGQLQNDHTGLIIRLKVQNRDNKPQSFLPANQMFIRSSDGQTFVMSPIKDLQEPVAAGEIAAGATVEGTVSFIIPNQSQNLRLFIDKRWNHDQPIILDIP